MKKKAEIGVGGIIVLVIAAIVLVPLVLWGGYYVFAYLFLPVHATTAQIDSAHQIIDKVNDPNNAIYNYEWFKQQKANIDATEKQIENMKQQLSDFKDTYGDSSGWSQDDKAEYNRISQVLIGQKNMYAQMVDDYNARASMADRNIFIDKLPMHVDKILW
jgi:glutamate synthase domain-containing protein 1